jgi:hypothetical protein
VDAFRFRQERHAEAQISRIHGQQWRGVCGEVPCSGLIRVEVPSSVTA